MLIVTTQTVLQITPLLPRFASLDDPAVWRAAPLQNQSILAPGSPSFSVMDSC